MDYVKTGVDRAVSGGAGELGLIKAVARWCEFLQGHVPVASALGALSDAADVDVVTLARVPHDSAERVSAVTFDRIKPTLGIARVDRAYSNMLLGKFSRSASPGTVWLKSLFGETASLPVEALHKSRGWNELAIVPLSQTSKSMDVLEFHVSTVLSDRYYLALNMIAGTLAETWERRRPGLLTEMLLTRSARESTEAQGLPLLSVSNPARLSRAEFRVCLLLGQGLSNERVMEQLDISLATLRTHLRNIYAKTDAEGHSDLLYKILNGMPAPQDAAARRAAG